MFMKPEDGNLDRPPKRQTDNKNDNKNIKKRELLGRYPPDRFEHISFQKPVSLIHSAGHERT